NRRLPPLCSRIPPPKQASSKHPNLRGTLASIINTAVVREGNENEDDLELAERLKEGRDRILAELRKVIVGQEKVIDQLLLSLFVGGNSLILGVPGLAKTLLVHSLAQVLNL